MEVLYAPKISKKVGSEFDSWVRFVSEIRVLLSECQCRLKSKHKIGDFGK